MENNNLQEAYEAKFTQIAYVVKDLTVAKSFFSKTMNIQSFGTPQIIRLGEFKSTYYNKRCDAESLVCMAYSGGIFIEIIQPLSGQSIFQDFLDINPAGGLHHMAYSVPHARLGQVASHMTDNGYPIIFSVKHPIADIIFFDTTKVMGVFTEFMGVNEEGEKAVENMKS